MARGLLESKSTPEIWEIARTPFGVMPVRSAIARPPFLEKRLSLRRHAADVDVMLPQQLKMSEREALSFTLPGFQGIGNPKGGGVAVLVRDTIPTKVVTSGITSRVEYATVCTPLSSTMLYWTSACLPLASRVSMDALEALTGQRVFTLLLRHRVSFASQDRRFAPWGPQNQSGNALVVAVASGSGCSAILNSGAAWGEGPRPVAPVR